MHRGVRWSILGVIFEAREAHKSQKKQLLLTLFFSVVFWCRKGGGEPRRECGELACGPLKEVIL